MCFVCLTTMSSYFVPVWFSVTWFKSFTSIAVADVSRQDCALCEMSSLKRNLDFIWRTVVVYWCLFLVVTSMYLFFDWMITLFAQTEVSV